MGSGVDSGIDSLKNFAIAAAGIGGAIDLGMQALDNMNVESRLAAKLGATGGLAEEYGDMAGGLYRDASRPRWKKQPTPSPSSHRLS
ncbi:hypothetical protein GS887_28175 [Rhodococcus hoagii]|nr:hypothetical protein [Prescottella equi]